MNQNARESKKLYKTAINLRLEQRFSVARPGVRNTNLSKSLPCPVHEAGPSSDQPHVAQMIHYRMKMIRQKSFLLCSFRNDTSI